MSAMYAGTILRVNLSEGAISRGLTSTYADDFLGGRGINTKILYDEVPPEVEPLDPASLLIFGVGPLCGTPIPASRVEVTFKSPETGFLGSANFGGFFGPELKFAGYDHVVITGKADKPVYLRIYNDQVEIRDAASIWGKDTYETQEILRSVGDPEARVVCIGQAGENLVRFATVQTELGHAAGRTGPGAVMGSKNLKAIVVRGTKGVALADPEQYLTLVTELQQELKNHPAMKLFKNGTTPLMRSQIVDYIPLEEAKKHKHRPHKLVLKHKPKRAGCLGCPAQCMDQYQVKGIGGTVMSCELYSEPFQNVKNSDLDLGLVVSLRAQRYGLDIDSSMVILHWLMELHESGIITAEDTDGIAMEWGSEEAILGMLEKMVHRERFGDVLADGLIAAAERIGRGSADYANHVKGLPTLYLLNLLYPEPQGVGLSLAVGSRGDLMKNAAMQFEKTIDQLPLLYDKKTAAEIEAHVRKKIREITGMEKGLPPVAHEEKPKFARASEDSITICDCLSACKWIGVGWYGIWPFAEESRKAALLSAGTGVETDVDTLFAYAAKVRTLERAYNVRQGMTRDSDTLPKRWMDKLTAEDHSEEDTFEAMKSKYYALRGWDPATGIPTRKALEEAGLADVAEDLEERGLN